MNESKKLNYYEIAKYYFCLIFVNNGCCAVLFNSCWLYDKIVAITQRSDWLQTKHSKLFFTKLRSLSRDSLTKLITSSATWNFIWFQLKNLKRDVRAYTYWYQSKQWTPTSWAGGVVPKRALAHVTFLSTEKLLVTSADQDRQMLTAMYTMVFQQTTPLIMMLPFLFTAGQNLEDTLAI